MLREICLLIACGVVEKAFLKALRKVSVMALRGCGEGVALLDLVKRVCDDVVVSASSHRMLFAWLELWIAVEARPVFCFLVGS